MWTFLSFPSAKRKSEEVFCVSSAKTVKKILTKFLGLLYLAIRSMKMVSYQQLSFLTLVMSETLVRATIISSLNLTILQNFSADIYLVKIPGFWDFQTSLAGCGCLPTENSFQAGVRWLRGAEGSSQAVSAAPLASCVCDCCCCYCSCYRLNIWELDWETERKPTIQMTVLTFVVATNNAATECPYPCVRAFRFMIWRSYRLFLMDISI